MKNLVFKIIYRILGFYARKVISKHDPFVVAVTGSVGKTSTKKAIYQVLRDKYGNNVRKNYGNLNAEIGIPLTILGYEKLPNKFFWPIFLLIAYFRTNVKKYPKYLVLEMGVEHKGDIEYFCSIVKPNIAVITSTSPAHIINFSSHDEFKKEKISLLKYLKKDGKAILNYDDPFLAKLDFDGAVYISALDKKADYKSESVKLGLNGTEFRISTTGHNISIKSKLLGRQMIYPSLFAFAVADQMGISLLDTGKSLEKIAPINGRMRPIPGKNKTVIIDDTYNSNPTSAKLALDYLSEVPYSGRKVAILGNMNELGEIEKDAHLELANYANGKCDLAVFIGPNSPAMQKVCDRSLAFESRDSFLKKADNILESGDLILVKASQNRNFFEEIVKILMENPKEAGKLLVRQGAEWRGKK